MLLLHTVKIKALLRKNRAITSELSGGSKFYFCQGYSVIATGSSAGLGMLSAQACQLFVRQMCYSDIAEGINHKWFSGKNARLLFDCFAVWFQYSSKTVFCSLSLQPFFLVVTVPERASHVSQKHISMSLYCEHLLI